MSWGISSYLTEWEPEGQRTALSLDPIVNEEEFPSRQLQRKLESTLGQPGEAWPKGSCDYECQIPGPSGQSSTCGSTLLPLTIHAQLVAV